jgi:hypothetical protein
MGRTAFKTLAELSDNDMAHLRVATTTSSTSG